jgi:hypothetical protein
LVLLSLGTEGNYILAILERTSGNPGLLTAENGLRISAPEREVVVEADRGVSLQSADRVSLSSAHLTMQSSQMELSADRMSLFGRVIHTQAQRIKNTAESVENLFSRLKEKLLQSHRKVEGMDLVQAAHITREAEDLYAAHSGYTVMTCREDMKIDAEHIHLG